LGLQQQRLRAYHAGLVRLTGTPHVSLPTDIIQLFGTGSVPVLVGGTVLGVFELGERFASQRAKDALSQWLLTFEVQKAKALPDGTQELFERIFGEHHFSWKCFGRSAAFSLGAILFLALIGFLVDPKRLVSIFTQLSTFNIVLIWLPWAIFIDYISLFKTRVIMRILAQLNWPRILMIGILAIDFLVYKSIFLFAFVTLALGDWPFDLLQMEIALNVALDQLLTSYYPKPTSLEAVLFWSGFAPSIWMWLYVAALFVTRALLRSEKLVNRLRWALDIEKNPFRSIGAVAAGLAFIASVAIILVSAEVSRISAAS
jgi:hypothetical protein